MHAGHAQVAFTATILSADADIAVAVAVATSSALLAAVHAVFVFAAHSSVGC